jgi:hypothetical protein
MKAISPVIIVAVAIAISIAVALWLTGIVERFTTVENLQITYADATIAFYTYKGSFITGWCVQLEIENNGTGTATIDEIFINGRRAKHIYNVTISEDLPLSIEPGQIYIIRIYLPKGAFSSGQEVEIKLHTASGKEYTKKVILPYLL